MSGKRGPKQKTIKDKHNNKLVFYIKDQKLNLRGKLDRISGMTFTGAQARGLRNWLNWFLNNK